MNIRSLLLTGNCMQSEGELRFCISLYEVFFKLRFRDSYIVSFYNSIEEYDPQTNKWSEVEEINIE